MQKLMDLSLDTEKSVTLNRLSDSEQFYPTSPMLADYMMGKVIDTPAVILDPQAGEGALLQAFERHIESKRLKYRTEYELCCMEINRKRQAILKSQDFKILGDDFLSWGGPDKFDLIVMNPPFRFGAAHLMKAIDILYSGQILCILNAETIRNPYTNERKDLLLKLEELNAEIEFMPDAFKQAEKNTDVEIALINIVVKRYVEEDLFAGCSASDVNFDHVDEIDGVKEVSNPKKNLEEIVAMYHLRQESCTKTIIEFYRLHKYTGEFLRLNEEIKNFHTYSFPEFSSPQNNSDSYKEKVTEEKKNSLTKEMKKMMNSTARLLRKTYWENVLKLPDVESKMTIKRVHEFHNAIKSQCLYEFNEVNVRTFLINLITGFDQAVMQSIIDLFDLFTIRHTYFDGRVGFHTENIHYYNGWKTNNAFKVGKKIILPFNAWDEIFKKWKLQYDIEVKIRDFHVVMNYLSDNPTPETFNSIRSLARQFEGGVVKGAETHFFTINAFKKGTMHFTFKDENVLRRFNVAAAIGKGWLPMDYGQRAYQNMARDEQQAVDSFEGKETYEQHLGQDIIQFKAVKSLVPALPFHDYQGSGINEVAEADADESDDLELLFELMD